MLDQKIDYPVITMKVLKSCGGVRNPDAASPDRFLKTREGNGAWGHMGLLVKDQRPEYGRIGFGVKSASVSTRAHTSTFTAESSLIRTASRGLITRHKQLVKKDHSNLRTHLEKLAL